MYDKVTARTQMKWDRGTDGGGIKIIFQLGGEVFMKLNDPQVVAVFICYMPNI
jgi:hypothetical protein